MKRDSRFVKQLFAAMILLLQMSSASVLAVARGGSVKVIPPVIASFSLNVSDLRSLRRFRLDPEHVPEFANILIRRAVLGFNLEEHIGALAWMEAEIRLASRESKRFQFTRFGNQVLILPNLLDLRVSKSRRELGARRRRVLRTSVETRDATNNEKSDYVKVGVIPDVSHWTDIFLLKATRQFVARLMDHVSSGRIDEVHTEFSRAYDDLEPFGVLALKTSPKLK
jgi:hypothetical protein